MTLAIVLAVALAILLVLRYMEQNKVMTSNRLTPAPAGPSGPHHHGDGDGDPQVNPPPGKP